MTKILPSQLQALRAAARLTQTVAAKMVHASMRTWQQWEAGNRQMPPAATELWCLAAYKAGYLRLGDVTPWVRGELTC